MKNLLINLILILFVTNTYSQSEILSSNGTPIYDTSDLIEFDNNLFFVGSEVLYDPKSIYYSDGITSHKIGSIDFNSVWGVQIVGNRLYFIGDGALYYVEQGPSYNIESVQNGIGNTFNMVHYNNEDYFSRDNSIYKISANSNIATEYLTVSQDIVKSFSSNTSLFEIAGKIFIPTENAIYYVEPLISASAILIGGSDQYEIRSTTKELGVKFGNKILYKTSFLNGNDGELVLIDASNPMPTISFINLFQTGTSFPEHLFNFENYVLFTAWNESENMRSVWHVDINGSSLADFEFMPNYESVSQNTDNPFAIANDKLFHQKEELIFGSTGFDQIVPDYCFGIDENLIYFDNAYYYTKFDDNLFAFNLFSCTTSNDNTAITCMQEADNFITKPLEFNNILYFISNASPEYDSRLFRFPERSDNGLCQTDCSADTTPPNCNSGPFTVKLDPGQDYYTFDPNDFATDDCSPILTYENASLDSSTPNGTSTFFWEGNDDQFSCGTYTITSASIFDANWSNYVDCTFTFTVECEGVDTCSNTVLSFTSKNEYITLSDVSVSTDFTLGAWVKPSGNNNGGVEDRIFAFGPSKRLEIGLVESGELWIYDYITGLNQTFTNIRDGQWHHIAFVSKGDNDRRLYLDYELIHSYVAGQANYGSSFRLGNWMGGPSLNESYSGLMDEVRMYNYAMPANDLCLAMNGDPVFDNALQIFLDFEDGIPSEDNTNITSVINQGQLIDGELTGFELIGDASNFVCYAYESCFDTPEECTDECQADIVDLSTGVNFIDGSLLPLGQYDGGWVMISGPDMSLNYPQPGFVVTPDGAWSDQLNAQFISPFANTANNMSFIEPYTFERKFCVCDASEVQLNIAALFDNFLEVGLYDVDGNQIQELINVQSNNTSNFMTPSTSTTTHQLVPGVYSIKAGLRNDSAVSMGFAIEATLSGVGLIESGCCSPFQFITGTVFEDMDCDSLFSLSSDPVLSEVVISLCDQSGQELQQTSTDAFGYFTFYDIQPGTYSVKQAEIDDLSMTLGGNGYQLNVEPNTVLSNIDFGNCSDPCVNDLIDPSCMIQQISIAIDESGQALLLAEMINDGSFDECGEVSFAIDKELFTCDELGENIVILTVTDESNNSSTCEANVKIEDKLPPICIAQDISITLNQNGTRNINASQIDNGTIDNCGEFSLELSQATFTCEDLGENEVTLTATDAQGNSSICTAIVTVSDILNPKCIAQDISVTLNQNGSFNLSPTDIDNGSSDNCGDVSLILSQTTFTCDEIGENQVTVTVTDQSGNERTCTVIVIVEDLMNACVDPCEIDSSPPILECPIGIGTFQLNNNGYLSLGIYDLDIGIIDECKTRIDISQTIFTCEDIGNNMITVTVIDQAGNSSSCNVNINIIDSDQNCDECFEDTESPTILCKDDVAIFTLGSNATLDLDVNILPVNVFDNCGIDQIVSEIPVLTCADLTTVPQSFNVIATDFSGNSSTCTVSYILLDPNNYCIPDECPEVCFASTINLSTGVDVRGAELALGEYEGNWQLISGPDMDANYPRPGYVLTPNAVWDQLPGSQYISPFPNASNNQSFSDPYLFERCFCVCEETAEVQLDIAAHVDNFIYIGLYDDSGTEIQELINYQSPANTATFLDPAFISNTSHTLTSGTYCLRAGLRNDASVTMGMQINASISNAGFITTECCNPNGSLLGSVFNDLNCDTLFNSNQDLDLSDIVVNLYQNNLLIESSPTDIYGYYIFSNLVPGDYVVKIETPADASMTLGENGYTVTLQSNSSVGDLNFGLCFPNELCCESDAILEATACQELTSASIEFDGALVTLSEPTLEECQMVSQVFWGDGTIDIVSEGEPMPTHKYSVNGTYVISVEILSFTLSGDVCNSMIIDLIYTIQDCTSSIQDPNEDTVVFKVYPVPFNDFVELQFNNNDNGFEGNIFDLTGAIILSVSIPPNVDDFTIQTTVWTSGIYTLRLVENNTLLNLSTRILKIE